MDGHSVILSYTNHIVVHSVEMKQIKYINRFMWIMKHEKYLKVVLKAQIQQIEIILRRGVQNFRLFSVAYTVYRPTRTVSCTMKAQRSPKTSES